MAKPQLSSMVVFNIDLGRGEAWSRDASRLSDTAEGLAEQLRASQLATSWMVPTTHEHSDRTFQLLQQIRQTQLKMDVGMRWDRADTSSVVDVFAFSAELRDQVDRFRERGLEPRALMLDPNGKYPFVAIAKAGFRVICPLAKPRNGVRRVQLQPLRHGLWGLPVSCGWPAPTRILQPYLRRQFMVQTRLTKSSDVMHLVLDLPRLARTDRHLSGIRQVVDHLAALRDEESIDVARLSDVRRQISEKMTSMPARSILHGTPTRRAPAIQTRSMAKAA